MAVQLDVRDVLEVAVGGQDAVLVLAAEQGDLDLLALVLVGVVLHRACRDLSDGRGQTIVAEVQLDHAAVRDRMDAARRSPASRRARIVPPCVTSRMPPPDGRARDALDRGEDARPMLLARLAVRPVRRRETRSSSSARVRPDHEPTSISRRPASAITGHAVRRGDDLRRLVRAATGRSSRRRRTASREAARPAREPARGRCR